MFAVLTESASRFNSALFLKPNLMLPERMLSTQLGKNLPFAAVDLLHVTFSFFFFSSLLLFRYDSWIPQIVKFASSFRFKYVWHDSEITFILCCISHPHTPESSNTHLRILLQLTKNTSENCIATNYSFSGPIWRLNLWNIYPLPPNILLGTASELASRE